MDHIESAAEKKLETLQHKEKTSSWNFEKLVRLHKDQNAILEGLKEHGYYGTDERSKARHLMNGIKCESINSVKTQILETQCLRNDFDACTDLCSSLLNQSLASKP